MIPLRMGHHRDISPVRHQTQGVIHIVPPLVKVKFNQQIPRICQGQHLLPVQQLWQLRRGKYFHTGTQLQPAAQLPEPLLQKVHIAAILLDRAPPSLIRPAKVGGCNDALGPVLPGLPGHGACLFHTAGSIIHTGENVAMHICHGDAPFLRGLRLRREGQQQSIIP